MTQKTEVTVLQKNSLPQIEMNGFSVMPKTFDEFYRFSNMLASSDLVPKDYKNNPGNVMTAIQMGAEIGLKPMQALQNIAVINGRPSLWGDAVLALIQGSGMLQDFKEWYDEKTGTAYCMMHRQGYSEPTVRSFSTDDAKNAGLLGKQGPWTQYRKRMLQMRARGFCARDTFADVLRGFWVAEEAEDIQPIAQPKVYNAEEVMPRRLSTVQNVEQKNEQVFEVEKPLPEVEFKAEEKKPNETIKPADVTQITTAMQSNPKVTKSDVSQILAKYGYKKVTEITYGHLDQIVSDVIGFEPQREPGSDDE